MNRLKKILTSAIAVFALAISGAVMAAPAQAATMPYHGSVDCAGYDVVGIWVDQPGNSGWAQYEQTGLAGWHNVYWYYTLNGTSYRLHVGCGGTQSNWLTTNLTPWVTGNHDFVCVPGQYCALS